MFPSPSTLPPGITLRTLDAASSVPHDLRGTFDIVNIRLLVGAITNNDPTPVLRNALSLLKPGGYIQWTEVFTPTNVLGSPIPRQNSFSNPARRLLDPLLSSIGMHDWETSWMNHLPQIFDQAGLKDIEVADLGSPRKEMWSSWGSNTLAYLRESVEGTPGDVEREEILEELEEEYASGVYIASDPRVVVGRKPLRAKL
jgi:hypothetical protein